MRATLATLLTLVCTTVASANVTVSGTGKVTYVPDIGYVGAGVSSDGKTAEEAWQKNAAAAQKLVEFLKNIGIEERDFKTSGIGLAPRYVQPKDQEPRLVGYTASYELSVTVRHLKDLGKLLDGLVAAGANRQMNISLGCSDPERLLDQARAKAVADARKKAEIYVAGAGADLGQVVSISEGSMSPLRSFSYEHMAPASNKALPIASGEQELSVSVTVVWGLNHTSAKPHAWNLPTRE
jgi:uncharacterized protein YggE